MQKLVKVENNYNETIEETIQEVNKLLEDEWEVIQMCPFSESVGTTGESYSSIKGKYGILLLLEKK